jgi:hypothetical protein
MHSSLGMPPFELTLSLPPRTLSLQAGPRKEEGTPRTAKQKFIERFKTLRIRAAGNLHQAQERYKESFDKNVRPKNSEVKEGEDVFLRGEVTEVGRNHKLESMVQGPYRMLENAGATFRLRIGAEYVRVSSDRVTPAPRRELSPSPEGNPTSSEPVPPNWSTVRVLVGPPRVRSVRKANTIVEARMAYRIIV